MGEAMLKEICPGVFIRDFRTGWYAVPQLNYSYIPGSGRSLMVDAGMPEGVSPDGLSLMSRTASSRTRTGTTWDWPTS